MNDGLLFANAAVKTKESGFFGTEKLGRLIDSDSLADAVRVLAEAGYGGGSIPDDPDDFERLLRDEESGRARLRIRASSVSGWKGTIIT